MGMDRLDEIFKARDRDMNGDRGEDVGTRFIGSNQTCVHGSMPRLVSL